MSPLSTARALEASALPQEPQAESSSDRAHVTSPDPATSAFGSTSASDSTSLFKPTSPSKHSTLQPVHPANLNDDTASADQAAITAPKPASDEVPWPTNSLPPDHIVSVLHSKISVSSPSTTTLKRKFCDPLNAVKTQQKRRKDEALFQPDERKKASSEFATPYQAT